MGPKWLAGYCKRPDLSVVSVLSVSSVLQSEHLGCQTRRLGTQTTRNCTSGMRTSGFHGSSAVGAQPQLQLLQIQPPCVSVANNAAGRGTCESNAPARAAGARSALSVWAWTPLACRWVHSGRGRLRAWRCGARGGRAEMGRRAPASAPTSRSRRPRHNVRAHLSRSYHAPTPSS
eukprot:170957-Chlamydomonas_euryale.AAC.9